jgi:hypothetical protein
MMLQRSIILFNFMIIFYSGFLYLKFPIIAMSPNNSFKSACIARSNNNLYLAEWLSRKTLKNNIKENSKKIILEKVGQFQPVNLFYF